MELPTVLHEGLVERCQLAPAHVKALVVHYHLRTCQRHAQRQRREGQVLAGEVGRLVGVVRAAKGHGHAGCVVALTSLGAPVQDPAAQAGGLLGQGLSGLMRWYDSSVV
jgi:hypothetical protein